MVFSSFTFLFIFLPVFLLLYFACPYRFKNFLALVASYLFYSWGSPQITLLLLLSSCFDYWVGQRLHGPKRRVLFIGAILVNLSLLAYFKYANFFVDQVSTLLTWGGADPLPWVKIALPAGISFFTFHKISYLSDIYTGRTAAANNLIDYLLYVAFFPQLIAGPILRYHDIADQIIARRHSAELFYSGFSRFCLGLGKKVLIADALGKTADTCFKMAAAGEALPSSYAWLGILAYSFQIYFDFSGYSDMAIGLARMLGFTFLENFNAPYIATTITDFWRRWHISLSLWMREYLYLPLGGNRYGTWRTYRNLLTVFFLSGLWHGASWTFVLWGLYHGLFLVLDRVFWARMSEAISKPLRIALTFLIVINGWVLFRSASLADALNYYRLLYDFSSLGEPLASTFRGSIIDNREAFCLLLAIVCSFTPAWSFAQNQWSKFWSWLPSAPQLCLRGGAALLVFFLSITVLSGSGFSPFLYFEF